MRLVCQAFYFAGKGGTSETGDGNTGRPAGRDSKGGIRLDVLQRKRSVCPAACGRRLNAKPQGLKLRQE